MRSTGFLKSQYVTVFCAPAGAQKPYTLSQKGSLRTAEEPIIPFLKIQLFYDRVVNRCQARRSSEPAMCGS